MRPPTWASHLTLIAPILMLGMTAQALAAAGNVVAQIDRVLMTADGTYGGCMAALSVDPQTVLPSCQSWWVTFSCSGIFTDALSAYRMVDLAELAIATDKKSQIFFRDDMTHNGYCFAYRIDVQR